MTQYFVFALTKIENFVDSFGSLYIEQMKHTAVTLKCEAFCIHYLRRSVKEYARLHVVYRYVDVYKTQLTFEYIYSVLHTWVIVTKRMTR